MLESKLKKYPITYKGKEYEVRWEYYGLVCIYEVTKYILGFKSYKYIYSAYASELTDMMEELDIEYDHKDIYIEEVKMLFKFWEIKKTTEEIKEKRKRSQHDALAEWNGVIE